MSVVVASIVPAFVSQAKTDITPLSLLAALLCLT